LPETFALTLDQCQSFRRCHLIWSAWRFLEPESPAVGRGRSRRDPPAIAITLRPPRLRQSAPASALSVTARRQRDRCRSRARLAVPMMQATP
jgi:hypothetical protein